jgi:hypothetical protein
MHFFGPDGDIIPVSAENPLPVTGAGGGGLTPEDITATAPLTATDNGDGTLTLAAAVGVVANTLAAGDDSRFTNARTPTGTAGGDLTGTYPSPTIGSAKVTVAKLATDVTAKLITQQAAIADLTAAPTMADFNALLAALRAAGVIAAS